MQIATDNRRSLAPLAWVAFGIAAGATAWLWMRYGMDVYAAQLASFGWICL